MKPMLADTTTLTELPGYVRDDQWWAQLKADGHRYLIVIDNGTVSVLNRAGQPKTSMVSHAVLAEFEGFDQGRWVIDGELVGNRLLVFDLAEAGGQVKPSDPFEHRYEVLRVLYEQVWQPRPDRVELLPVARTEDEKLLLAKVAQDERREGIMLRRRSGIYAPGHRSTHLLKCKFTHDVDCIVTELGRDGHDNVVLSLLDPSAPCGCPENAPCRHRVREVGAASAIGKRPVPQVGDVWEVRFLYVVDPANPRLYQPRLMRKRTDKGFGECLISQLDTAWTDKDLNVRTRSEM